MRFVLLLLCLSSLNCYSQLRKYVFFDFVQDSLKARSLNCSAPANMQTFALNNSLVTDYVGNCRFSLVTGVLSAKKDTLLALHSLVNGSGNIGVDFEWPFVCIPTRKEHKRDFIGMSLHPRISTIINNTQTFETSMMNYDIGVNLCGRLTGDLGTIAVKYCIRNAVCGGNNQFVKSAFNFSKNNFYYTSVQLKVRAGSNVLSFTLLLWVYGFENKWIKHLPVYAGYSLLF